MAFDPVSLGLIGGSALAGGLSSLFAKKPKFQQVQRFTPQQQQAQNQALQMALSGLQNPNAGFEPIANQARQQFNSQTVPSLAERFTAMGNGQRSSAFQGALGSAGADLESQLAALQAQYGLQNRSQLMQLLGQGLEPQFENAYNPGGGGFSSGIFGGLSGGLGALGISGLLGSNNAQGAFQPRQQLPSQGAAATVAEMFSPDAYNPGQSNLKNFLGGNRPPLPTTPNQGQQNFAQFLNSNRFPNPLTSRFFNPMMQG